MYEYLSFQRLIAQDILITLYYFGVIATPIFLWYIRSFIMKKLTSAKDIENIVTNYYAQLSLKNKIKLWFVFISLFICMQLCWRMIFEMMVAYFHMHEYLYEINTKMQEVR